VRGGGRHTWLCLGWRALWQGKSRGIRPGLRTARQPARALRLAPATIECLHDVGIERIAQLASKPRASLQTRFGSEVLLRMDQAPGSHRVSNQRIKGAISSVKRG